MRDTAEGENGISCAMGFLSSTFIAQFIKYVKETVYMMIYIKVGKERKRNRWGERHHGSYRMERSILPNVDYALDVCDTTARSPYRIGIPLRTCFRFLFFLLFPPLTASYGNCQKHTGK